MRASAKLTAYAVVLAVVLAGGAAVGAAVGPLDDGSEGPPPVPSRHATIDGYDVRLDGSVTAGGESELGFVVERDGESVRDLEPYLGAYVHLVAIRATDHAYLHVHPTEDSSPEEVVFAVDVPSPGAYRLFLDFRHEGVVRTAAFTLDVPAGTSGAAGEHHGEDGDDGGH